MKPLFSPQIFKNFLNILMILFFIKFLWFTVTVLWLPSSSIDYLNTKPLKALYYKVKLSPNTQDAPVEVKTKTKAQDRSMKDIKLLAIYNASDITVVTVLFKSKTTILSRGETINGFILEGAGNDFATFSKKTTTYRINLVKSSPSKKGSFVEVLASSPVIEKDEISIKGVVADAGTHKIIDKPLFDHYVNNMDEIYKNIGISEVKEGKELKGFRVSFIKKGSPFAKLGIKKDDIIKSINGQEISSYNAAFSVYKNIQNIENLSMVIQRGKEEMELEYEVN